MISFMKHSAHPSLDCKELWARVPARRSYQLSISRPHDLPLFLIGRGRRDSQCVSELSAPVVNRSSGANPGSRDRRASLLYSSTDQRTSCLSRFGPSERGFEVLPAEADTPGYPSGLRRGKNHHIVLSGSGPRTSRIPRSRRRSRSEQLIIGNARSLLEYHSRLHASIYPLKRDREKLHASARSGLQPNFLNSRNHARRRRYV